MNRFGVLGLLLLLSGCGGGLSQSLSDTWNKFLTPDFSWNRDRAVSADRAPARTLEGSGAATASPMSRYAAPASRPATRTAAAQSGCYVGRLTGEGNTCQAMRTNGGNLLMLAGPLRGFGTGDAVCVCGIPSAQQFCNQGLTFLIREIDTDCGSIR
jgi:hypothetical protein